MSPRAAWAAGVAVLRHGSARRRLFCGRSAIVEPVALASIQVVAGGWQIYSFDYAHAFLPCRTWAGRHFGSRGRWVCPSAGLQWQVGSWNPPCYALLRPVSRRKTTEGNLSFIGKGCNRV